jgi:hypothetical protein
MSISPAYSAPHATMLLEVMRERIRAKQSANGAIIHELD